MLNGQSPKPILFCDFDGVLCFDKYWRSLLPDEFEKVQELLFRGDQTIVNEWMRGKRTSEEVSQLIAEKTGISFDYLWNIFVQDCKTMHVSIDLLEKLDSLREKYIVILITGNMDSFGRFTKPALNLNNYFDHISNSFDEGLLKTDNKGEVFLRYCDKYGVPIEQCILFDDSKSVHKVFSELFGIAHLVSTERNLESHLEHFVIKS